MTDQVPDEQSDVPAGASGEPVAADLGPRFLARVIDGVLLWVVFLVIIVPIVVVALSAGLSALVRPSEGASVRAVSSRASFGRRSLSGTSP